MHKVRHIRLIGDVGIAARYQQFARNKAEVFAKQGVTSQRRKIELADAFIDIWIQNGRSDITIEGFGGSGIVLSIRRSADSHAAVAEWKPLEDALTKKTLRGAVTLESFAGSRKRYCYIDTANDQMWRRDFGSESDTDVELTAVDPALVVGKSFAAGSPWVVHKTSTPAMKRHNIESDVIDAGFTTPPGYDTTNPDYYNSWQVCDGNRYLWRYTPNGSSGTKYYTSDDVGHSWDENDLPDADVGAWDTAHFVHLGQGVVILFGVYVPEGAGADIDLVSFRAYKSDDNAVSWTLKYEDFSLPDESKVVKWGDGKKSYVMYGTERHTYSSIDGGNTWVKTNIYVPFPDVTSIAEETVGLHAQGNKFFGLSGAAYLISVTSLGADKHKDITVPTGFELPATLITHGPADHVSLK